MHIHEASVNRWEICTDAESVSEFGLSLVLFLWNVGFSVFLMRTSTKGRSGDSSTSWATAAPITAFLLDYVCWTANRINKCVTFCTRTYLFLLFSQAIPHGGHDLRHFPKGGVRVLGFDVGLGVSKEQGVGRHRLHRLVGVLSLFFLWRFGFLWDVNGCWPLLTLLRSTREVKLDTTAFKGQIKRNN